MDTDSYSHYTKKRKRKIKTIKLSLKGKACGEARESSKNSSVFMSF